MKAAPGCTVQRLKEGWSNDGAKAFIQRTSYEILACLLAVLSNINPH